MSGALGLTVLGLHGMTWWVVTGRILAGLPAAIEQADEAGWRLQGDAPERAGWPWTATVRVGHFVASRAPGSEPARWTADAMLLTISPLDPARLHLSWTGNQVASVGDTRVPFHASRADALAPLRGGPVTLDIRDLVVGPWPGSAPEQTVAVTSVGGAIAPLGVSVTADGVVLHPPLPAPFGGPATVSARLTTTAAFPDAPTPARSAAAWRAAGGRVDVPEWSLASGPLQASGRAEGGLDAGLQPQGRADLRVVGAPAVLDAAARAGWLEPGPARAARAVLQLLTAGAAGGPVPVTVTLEDRTLTVAQFPLLRLPSLDWDAP